MTGAIGRGAPDATALKIAEDFDRPDAQTRRDILRAILDRLQEHEWKQVVQRLEQLRSKYSYDIIGSLPLAVLLLVTEYLEPWDIVRSQRVSKRWRSVLSCDAVIKQALRSTLAFLELETEDVRAAASIFRWKRNLCRYRRLSWVTESGNCIRTMDLANGNIRDWYTRRKAPIETYRLSSKCLVMLSEDGFVTVRDLVGKMIRKTYRARKFHFWATPEIIVEDYTVVMFCRWQGGSKPVIVWDTYHDDVRRIGKFCNLWLVHLDTVDDVLSVFTLSEHGDSPLVQLEQTIWLLSGKKLYTRLVQLKTPGPRRLVWKDIQNNLRECTVSHSRDRIVQFLTKEVGSDMLYVTYDRAMDKLSARWIEYPMDKPSARWISRFDSGDSVLLSQSLVCRWLEPNRILFYNAASDFSTIIPYQMHVREDYTDGYSLRPFGDREVFGIQTFRGTQLWLFNPEFDASDNIDGPEDFIEAKERTSSPHFAI